MNIHVNLVVVAFGAIGCCHAFLPSWRPLGEVSTRLSSTLRYPQPVAKKDSDLIFEEYAEPETTREQFNWFKAWYPLVPVEILDPDVPHRYNLLGMDLVVWKDATIEGGKFGSKKKRSKNAKRVGGQWRVFVDECPHRKVPLSEGRIEDDGSLLCSYHGYRFNGQGECIDIPQISKMEDFSLERIASNPKSSCNSFPVQEIDGLMWVWPETGDDARLESALTPPRHNKGADDVDPDRVWCGPWNYRELPYSADYFMENVVDPAHVTISHHGIVGNRYDDQSLICESKDPLTKNGFSFTARTPHQEQPSTTTYNAPSSVVIDAPFGSEGALQTLELYASPSRPGFCNHVGRMVVLKDKSGNMPKLLKQFTVPIPKWINHLIAATFLNQDAVFLHFQERNLAKTGSYISHEPSDKTNYMSSMFLSKGDVGVAKYRTWLSKLAGGFVPYQNGASMPEANPDVCFDQWHSHTSKCRYCLGALAGLRKARIAAFVLTAILGVGQPFPKKALNLVGTLAAAGVGFGINKVIGFFYKQPYSHSQND
ncbi:hypothetical protein ACA910_014576 [Epithemia clementina (nom. ined.)]